MKKKYLLILMILLVLFTVFLTACWDKEKGVSLGSKNAVVERLSETYIAIAIREFHDVIYDEDVFKNYLYYLTYEKSKVNHTEEQAVVVRVDLDDTDNHEIIPLNIPVAQQIRKIVISDDEIMHILTVQQGDNWELVDMFWHWIDQEGLIIKTVIITEAIRECESHLISDFKLDAEENAYIAIFSNFTPSGMNDIFVINPNGDLLLKVPTKNIIDFMFNDTERNVYAYHDAAISNMGGFVTNVITKIDVAMQNQNDIDITAFNNGISINGLSFNTKDSLFLVNNNGGFDIELNSDTIMNRFSWLSIGITPSLDGRAYPLQNGGILWANWPSGTGYGAAVAVPYSIIRLQTDEDIAAVEAAAKEWEQLLASEKVGNITLGTIGRSVTPEINKAIDDFNNANPYSRIHVKQYGNLYGDDQSEGINQLNNDIVSGKCPDVLLLHQDLSFGAYVNKGVFADLNPYIQADETINMPDYYENVFKAYEIGGSLYGIPLSFYVDTMYGKAAELLGKTEWNFDEFVSFVDRFNNTLMFHYPTKTKVLDICLKANGDNIVDWASKQADFDRALLIKVLEFSNRFIDDDRYSEENMVIDRISMGDIHLMTGVASPSTQFAMEIFGEPIKHIGYPTENGKGYLITAYSVAAISSKCINTDTAWKFISYLLSEEVQTNGISNGYPVKRSSIEPIIEFAKKGGGFSSYFDYGIDISYEDRGATDEEIELFLDLLDTASKIRVFDQEIDSIIKEEASFYFSGIKSVIEVVDIIENRVGIYVKETK